MIWLCSVCFLLAFLNSASDAATCGIQSCPETKPDMLNVHLVPHTHDDVGWLKTVDQYYYGAANNYQNAGVQYVLDSVVSELQKDPSRRFIYVETAFFWRWWQDQNDVTKEIVIQLVNEGRLEFILGGWCMSDEATPHYSAMIDQMTLGLKFLNDTFGECGVPRVAWQIDPFGHSREVAAEFALMGFDGLFFGRLDYEDKNQRLNTKTMEIIWQGSPNVGADADLFTGALFNGYGPPGGFCFDVLCGDEPIMDNPKLHGYNVDQRVNDFIDASKRWAEPYQTNHILMTMGTDFLYQGAQHWYTNLDKLIKYVNQRQAEGGDVNVIYSTPSCYLAAVNEALTTNLTVKEDDFFPYASDPNAYWTGYFTSRAALKLYTYRANNFLQVCKQIRTTLGSDLAEEEFTLKQAMGILQHHDAVSGTEKQHVANDYALYLAEGIAACEKVVNAAYGSWLKKSEPVPEQSFCPLLNISVCETTASSNRFVVTLYNPIARPVNNSHVRVPVSGSQYTVTGPDGSVIPSQVVPVPDSVLQIPGRNATTTQELVFTIPQLPSLSVQSFFVEASSSSNRRKRYANGRRPARRSTRSNKAGATVVDNGMIQLTFDETSGLLQSATRNNVTWSLAQNFYVYQGSDGSEERASGAYAFNPANDVAEAVSESATIEVFSGDVVTEVHQVFNSWISQIIRLYNGEDEIEFEWRIGPIPVDDDIGREIVTRYSTDLATNGEIYTDANGRELLKRVRDFRPTWNLTVTEPTAGNVYPSTTGVIIRDTSDGRQLTVVIDRPEGVGSLKDGDLGIMLHRRLLHDDGFGVGEPLNETAYGDGLVVRGRHVVQLGSSADSISPAVRYRLRAQETVLSPWPSFVATDLTQEEWSDTYNTQAQAVSTINLPNNVNLLTLEQWTDPSQVLVRLEHLFEIDEDEELSQAVTVDLQDLFGSSEIASVEELTLGANQLKSSLKRMQWPTESKRTNKQPKLSLDGTQVTLNPMEIATLLVTLA